VWLVTPLPKQAKTRVIQVIDQISDFQAVPWQFHINIGFISIAATLVTGIIAYYVSAQAANISVPLWALMWMWAAVCILRRLPITIAGLGLREWTLTAFLSLYQVEPSNAVIMSLVIFSAGIFMAALGGLFQLSRTMSRHAPKTGTE
jgi:hypothetical protein